VPVLPAVFPPVETPKDNPAPTPAPPESTKDPLLNPAEIPPSAFTSKLPTDDKVPEDACVLLPVMKID
jgi:hypothetical protein